MRDVGERAAHDMAVAFAQARGGVAYRQMAANEFLLGRKPRIAARPA